MVRLGDDMTRLGLSLQLSESYKSIDDWLKARQASSHTIGTVATTWHVTKTTRRHDISVVGAPDGWVGGIVSRDLLLTGLGYLVERDGMGVVSVHALAELVAIVRHSQPSNQLTLEYANGQMQTYPSAARDALLVAILDASATLAKNTTVCVSDESLTRYRLGALTTNETTMDGPASLFQPVSIPNYCLKKVQALATRTFAYVSGQFASVVPPPPQDAPINLLEEYHAVVEACREFNASVLLTGEGIGDGGKSDKNITATIGALWGLIGKLLQQYSTGNGETTIQNMNETMQAEAIATTLFQTLHRLSQTPTGYKGSVELTTLQVTMPLLWNINDAFCKWSAFQVLTVLLSGQPNRDLETEYVNKSVIFKGTGQALVEGIVAALVTPSTGHSTADSGPGPGVSELVLMAASDLLQSILCTYHDTTSPDHFGAFIAALSDRYRSLLNTLRSQTPCVIENTALLLHLLSSHAPQTAAAIRDAALSSSILLQHFHAAIFSPLESQRFLSRYLCSLWMAGPMDCDEKRLLKRMVPAGFLAYLNMPLLSPMEEDQLDDLEHDVVEENIRDAAGRGSVPYQESAPASGVVQSGAGTNTARLRKRIAIASAAAKQSAPTARQENFRVFFHVLTQGKSCIAFWFREFDDR